MSLIDHLLYALLWLSFGAGHSLLAGERGRRWLAPLVGRWHRLAYNLVATVHIALVWGIGRFALAGDATSFDLPWPLQALQLAALGLGLVLFWAGGRGYDLKRFMGVVPEAPDAPPEPLVTSGIHARVRHPLYLAGYLVLFASVGDPFSLATALWGALYLAIGTVFEERRLIGVHGEAYRDYRRRVPAILPRLGRRPAS